MHGKPSFFKQSPKTIAKVLLVSLLMALTVPLVFWLLKVFFDFDPNLGGAVWILAALCFCSGISFYDDKYTRLRGIGCLIGAITATVMINLIADDGQPVGAVMFHSIFMGILGAIMGYLVVAYEELISGPRHWHW